MRRYVLVLCTVLCIHLVFYGNIYMCSQTNYKPGNLSCLTNYADRISCIWYKGSYSGNGPFFITLEENDVDDDYEYDEASRKCHLVSSRDAKSFSCNLSYLVPFDMDDYKIEVQGPSSEILATIESFVPICNIKLDPPSDLSYNFTGTAYNLTWRGNTDFVTGTRIHYQLKLKREASRQETLKKSIYDKYVELLVSEFDEGSNYIQIRCITEDQEDFKSLWSEWSSELKIEKEVELHVSQNQDIIHIITIVTLLTITPVLLFLVLRSNLSSRINVSFSKKIPTAANFFHPLYHIHNGNFQDWTKYPKKCKENKKGGEHDFPQDIDLYSTTVLYVQKEVVSNVRLESPLSKDDISLEHDTSNSMSWSDLLVEKELSFNGMYPPFFSSFPSFSNDIINDAVCSLDCPTDYFSYDGNYIPNSQDIVE
ncbi:interleukin-9 receptor-like isoform X2 [Bufo gargarizans]|uniref:interleukin-9 receptor-like isoform X2 n=1 Tax=Bufo gargarizans TaxID=30331 RepID=UPI001CF482DE|nr:interleukin-9 receptor-like isoform X2 [Bufo gargarizans]